MLWDVLALCVCCALGLAAGRSTGAEDGETLQKINSARCTSRCLTLYMTQLASAFKHIQSDDVLGWCESHRRCSQCLQPCMELWETRGTVSPRSCEKHYECVTSAEFLLSLGEQKQGDCPPPQRASGFAAACVESCGTDPECSGTKKCCSNGCGHTCQPPANLYKGVPLKPRKDMSFLEEQDGRLAVVWMSRFNVSVEPVLYVLQRRWNYGIHPSEDDASPWQTLLTTMEDRVVLRDVRPHRWYQFRVSAVNSQGTRGFTTPSKHFFSIRDPFPPGTPQHVRTGNVTVNGDGTVNVPILWDPPGEDDLEIHHYKVTWGVRGAPMLSHSRREVAKVTDGAQTALELRGLQPNTAYVGQVQAVTHWAQKRLKSPRALLNFNTTTSTIASTSSPTGSPGWPDHRLSRGEFSNELPLSHSASSIQRVQAAAPHYHDNQLQVKVFWKSRQQAEGQRDSSSYLLRWYPEVCANNMTKREQTATVQGTHFVITGLLFACKYEVGVMPMGGIGQGSEVMTSVTTPQCISLKGRGKKALSCGKNGRHLLVRKALVRPERLAAEFRAVNGSVRGVFRWRLSRSAPAQTPVTGLRVSWVRVAPGGGSRGGGDTPDTPISQTRILPADQLSLTVDGLLPQSVYRVQVHVLSEGSNSGPSVARTLHTPQINGTPM